MQFRKSLVFILCLFSLSTLQAQKSKFSGYTVNAKGDTTRGYLKYRSYAKSALGCNFSEDGTNYQVLGVNEIQAYGMDDGKHFRKKQLPGGKSIFLEVFYQGSYALYTTKESNAGTAFYIDGPNEGLRELRIRKVAGTSTEVKEYRNVLLTLLPENDVLVENINNASLNKKSLAKIFSIHDAQQGNAFKTLGGNLKTPVVLSAMAGVNLSTLNIETQSGEQSHTGVTVGFGIAKELSKGSGRFWIEAEMQVSSREYSQLFTAPYQFGEEINGLKVTHRFNPINVVGVDAPDYIIDLSYKSTYLSVPLMLKYSFPVSGFSLSLSAGLQPILELDQTVNVREQITRGGFDYYNETHDDIIPTFQNSYVGGLGLKSTGKLPLELLLRYTNQISLAGANGGVIGINTLQVLVKLPLTKR